MAPVKITLNDHYKGDTWPGIIVGPVLINSVQPTSNLASVRLQFRDEDDVLGHEFNTVGGAGIGTITIDDPVTWEITVPAQLLDLDAGTVIKGMKNKKTWYWDFETTDANGDIITLYTGTIKVSEDVSG